MGENLRSFTPKTETEIRKLILESETKTSSINPIPTFLLKELVDVLLGYITAMINASLEQAQFPGSEKSSVITPKLKKNNLDRNKIFNYRPISNLSFISKIMERIVANQLNFILPRMICFPNSNMRTAEIIQRRRRCCISCQMYLKL